MTRVLVIGGTGFIGSHVVRCLRGENHDVLLFNRGRTEADLPPGLIRVRGDRADLHSHREDFARFSPEVVLDTSPMTEDHALAVVHAFRGTARRVVALSSMDVYRAYGVFQGLEEELLEPVPFDEEAPLRKRLYPYRGESPRREGDPLRWVDDYDKILVERHVMETPGLEGTVLRLPMVYGPGDNQHRLFPYLKRMDDGRPAILLEERLSAWRWTRGYVEDVARGIARAAVNGRAAGRIYNIGEAEALSEADWVAAIGAAAGWRGRVVPVSHDRLPARFKVPGNFAQDLVGDTVRIRKDLGFQERFSRGEALRRAVEWEREHPPPEVPGDAFDYAGEDDILRNMD